MPAYLGILLAACVVAVVGGAALLPVAWRWAAR